jgi:hypothetical protein
MLENSNQELADSVKKSLEDCIVPSWQARGLSTIEFAEQLKNNLTEVNDMLKSGQGDTSIIKSTISDTFEFLAYSLITKEIQGAKSMIDTHLMKENLKNGNSTKTRIIKGG